MHRSSRPEVSCKKGVLGHFAKFTGQHLCQNLFFNKVVGLRSANLLKKRLWHSCFPVNFAEFLRTHFLAEHRRWLLLNAKVFTCKISNSHEETFICLGNFEFSVVPRASFLLDGEPLPCTDKAKLIHLILIELLFIEDNDISDEPCNQWQKVLVVDGMTIQNELHKNAKITS